jgi:hypothetical protein
MLDRSYIAKCLAKAIAYKCCGKDQEAAQWARELIKALELADILN